MTTDPIRISSASRSQAIDPAVKAKPASLLGASAFDAALKDAMHRGTAVRFSAHALQRLAERKLQLGEADRAALARAVDAAAEKGARNTLVMMNGIGLVTNVPNRTVITIVPSSEHEDVVFTNIDSAVVVATPAAQSASELSNTNHSNRNNGLDSLGRSPRAAE